MNKQVFRNEGPLVDL